MEAQNYAGEGRVYSKEVSVDDVAWIGPLQGQFAKVEETEEPKGAISPLSKAETALHNPVAKVLNTMGIKTHLDAKAQRILDEDNERRAKLMGSKTNNKMLDVANKLKGAKMSNDQSIIFDVFAGRKDNQVVTFTRADGSRVKMNFEQGNNTGAGTKHSLYGHYNTTKGVIEVSDILKIPEIIEKGHKKDTGNKVEYTLKDGKTTFMVYAKKVGGHEMFQDFYSSWKIKHEKVSTSKPSIAQNGENTQSAQSDDAKTLSGANLQKVPEYDKEETEKIFDAANQRFGTTQDMREAGYILPDGTMLE